MDRFFKLKENGTNIRTEIIAGFTTFFTMAYIIFVNPDMLSMTGMDWGAVFVATIIAAAIGTLVMGLVANVPFAQAPGMGLNAFFTYTVVITMGFTWQQALGIVFICGIINVVITVTRIRKILVKAIPEFLQHSISAGIGLFIAYIGVKNARFIEFTSDGTSILAKFTEPVSQLALIGLLIIVVLTILKVRGSILIGIIAATIIGIFMGVTNIPSVAAKDFLPPSIAPTLFKLDIGGLFADPSKIMLVLTTILAFSLSDTFDTIGTFLGTGRKTGVFDDKDVQNLHKGKGFSSKLDKALFADATATSMGALLGTSNTTTYIESAAGISVGGKTGLTSVVTAVLFISALFIAPFAGMVPAAATAPALIVVGILMMGSIRKIEWDNFEEAAAAFFTVIIMPFASSIAHGVAAGFIFYVISKVVKGKINKVHPIMYIVTALFILSFVLEAII